MSHHVDIYLDRDELYPVFEFSLEWDRAGVVKASVPQETIDRWNRIKQEWEAMQNELQKLYEANDPEYEPTPSNKTGPKFELVVNENGGAAVTTAFRYKVEPPVPGENPKLKCADCGKVKGDPGLHGVPVNVRMFHGKLMCSDCEDALCSAWESD